MKPPRSRPVAAPGARQGPLRGPGALAAGPAKPDPRKRLGWVAALIALGVGSTAHGATEATKAVVKAIEKREPAQPEGLQLVAFAKAYSGLTDEEFKSIDSVIRKTPLEKFGPVRSVRPTLVFELGFEGINRSPRHKSGIAVRFPRMLRIRNDKPLHQADTLDTLKVLLNL